MSHGLARLSLGLCLALTPAVCPAEEEAPAPTGKAEQMKAPAKLKVARPMNEDSGKIESNQTHGEVLPSMNVNQFRLHILKQEMEFNPELKEKVENYLNRKMHERMIQRQMRAKSAAEADQPHFNGWMFDNLRKLYQAQGKELPEILQTADKFERAGKEPNWEEANSPMEYLEMIRKHQEDMGLTSHSITDGLTMVEEAAKPTSDQLMGMSLAERLRVNRTRFAKARSAYDKELEAAKKEEEENPEADNELLTLEKGEAVEEAEDDTLAYIENESAKETFGPGQLMWFEQKDDTLPIAGPAARNIPRGELENTWQELEELTADLEEEDRKALPHRNISAENFNRPGVDIPVATFVENARTETEEVRKAKMIQESLQKSKENRRRMLRPSMDVYSTRRFMVPHDLLGPNAFRAWDDSRFEKPKQPVAAPPELPELPN